MKEIERQFVCAPPPNRVIQAADRALRIRQGYLNDGDPAVRVRLQDDEWLLTVKSGRGLVREEVELPIDAVAGSALLDMAGECRLEKTRYLIGPWELDVFDGKLRGLVVLEVELDAEDAPLPPFPEDLHVWFEATGSSEVRNQALAGLSPSEAGALVERLARQSASR